MTDALKSYLFRGAAAHRTLRKVAPGFARVLESRLSRPFCVCCFVYRSLSASCESQQPSPVCLSAMVCELKGKKRVRAQWQAAPKQITCVSANHPLMEQHYLTMKMHRTWRFLGCWRPNVLDKMQHWGWNKFCSSASSGISALGRLSFLVTLGFFVTSCTMAHFSLHCSWKEQFCFLL